MGKIFGSRTAILVRSMPIHSMSHRVSSPKASYFHSSLVYRHSGSSECIFYFPKPVSVTMAVRMGQGSGQQFMSQLTIEVF